MRHLQRSTFIRGTLAAVPIVLLILSIGRTPSVLVTNVAEAAAGPCALSQPAFCETFDQPAGTGNRAGQLNGTLWGVSRASGLVNFGQGEFDAWSPTQLQSCGGTITVQPPNDVIICNGQVREAVDDLTSVTTLAMYPKQPFDFAGRTGIATFDVSNDTQGPHTVWPEFWITDQPVPTPFTHFASWLAGPRNGFGIRLSAMTTPYQGYNIAPACPNDANNRWSVESVVVSRNYVLDDQDNGGTAHATMLDCVIASSGPGNMNHVEIHVSQNQIDIYATDAGTTAPLHHIGVVQNANLTLTRGLVWIEDAHYNADKFGQHDQEQHTFSWDNVGFDGPVLPRDLAFDVLDALVPVALHPGELSLGWGEAPNQGIPQVIAGVTGIQQAVAALLTFNFYQPNLVPTTFTYVVNGHVHTAGWPYPNQTSGTWRTLALPVPVSDVLPLANTVSIASDQQMAVANIDLVLSGAGGGGTVGSGGSTGSTGSTGTTGSSATATPTASSASLGSPTATPKPTTATPTATAPAKTPSPTSTPTNGYTVSVQMSAPSVSDGSTETLTAKVTSSAYAKVVAVISVCDQTGKAVFQQVFGTETFVGAGDSKIYVTSWNIPSTTAKAMYTVKVALFTPDWAPLATLNNAAQFSVTSPQ